MKQELREKLGQIVHSTWMEWVRTHGMPSALSVTWEDLSVEGREECCLIGEAVADYLITDLLEQVRGEAQKQRKEETI